ncbi:alpha/beta hydrolase [Streptomyces sp. NPDC048550]|uniref:alpha/beta hydrolase n=1 Tax=Streptomyces sp. NPDC048550 TaxID=3155739 RepID=UPI003447B7A9
MLTSLRPDCDVWNVPAAPRSIRDVTKSDIPTLAISGGFDAQTAADNGPYVARTLPRATVVTVPDEPHVVFATSKCARSITVSFFDTPTAPNTDCLKDRKPRSSTSPPEPTSFQARRLAGQDSRRQRLLARARNTPRGGCLLCHLPRSPHRPSGPARLFAALGLPGPPPRHRSESSSRGGVPRTLPAPASPTWWPPGSRRAARSSTGLLVRETEAGRLSCEALQHRRALPAPSTRRGVRLAQPASPKPLPLRHSLPPPPHQKDSGERCECRGVRRVGAAYDTSRSGCVVATARTGSAADVHTSSGSPPGSGSPILSSQGGGV